MNFKEYLKNPLLNFLFFSYVLNATWEWSQTPFFIDITPELNTIVWYRIHCSLGDTLIMLAIFLILSLYYKGSGWLRHIKVKHYLFFVTIGFAYTFLSEYRNVYITQLWSYSEYMPVIPYFGVGLIPLIQWLVLPPIVLFITNRQIF